MTAVARDQMPGAVGISRLSVYDSLAPDGLFGGTPHMHLTCSEGYVVTAGEGHVQTLSGEGYRETPLRTGTVAWFPPGTIHRLVNEGGLQIVVVMQNSGLPEAGDAVLTFPPDVLADPAAYAEAATLPEGGAPGTDLGAAFRRRDLAVTGFLALRESGPDGLAAFQAAAARLVAPKLPGWRERWERGALRVALETGRQIDALAAGDASHLGAGGINVLPAPSEHGRHGMCGLLDTYHATAA
ncbi:cupin domain-containing protein [Dactylosporangium aurantiacum]|uniref:cupin domain-containing protein n=1 Tax=Dactylosporangium aurantiacum TaxID=35754 RepID=UPI001FE06A7A|nr:cupin domain-containing protein [Dactylosporangium aurantiacum]MDG6109178.1 cupin domain-containing protein [Dactylosporangium aurantiacum]